MIIVVLLNAGNAETLLGAVALLCFVSASRSGFEVLDDLDL
jgi:hypothetical protein